MRKLTKQGQQRKLLIQLMEQAEIFYEAQFKDAKTVCNAYRIYGQKVHTVKKKLDETIAQRFTYTNPSSNANNDKLDALDMEMSDDESEPEKASASHKSSYSSSNNVAASQSTSSSLMNLVTNRSFAANGSSTLTSSSSQHSPAANIRTHLDPRQNRQNSGNKHQSESANNSTNKRKSSDEWVI